ncbi:MAG: L-alanine exporter AlaE [Nanoarchaeota archaeon]
MSEPLEGIVKHSPLQNELRRIAADGLASALYAETLAFGRECLYSSLREGFNWEQVMHSRQWGVPTSLIFGGLFFGHYRNLIWKKAKTHENSSHLRKGLTDFTANTTFWAPVYSFILHKAGTENTDIALLATLTPILEPLLFARPYGWVMDQFRKRFGYTRSYPISPPAEKT